MRASFDHDAGFRAALALLERHDRPTAIVCGNDVIAIGVLSGARTLGLDVPGDVTVIGFDDIAMAAWPLVGLTTVRSDLDALAAGAAELLVSVIADPAGAFVERRVPVRLVRRSTHGQPSSP